MPSVGPFEARAALQTMLDRFAIHVVSFDEAQARIALDARIRFGKGFGHPAQPIYGDSFTYALAKLRGAPLLFVGEDFIHTDLIAAL